MSYPFGPFNLYFWSLLFGFSGTGKRGRQVIPFRQRKDRKKEEQPMLDMHRLTLCGYTEDQAALAISKRKGHDLAESTLKRKYSDQYGEIFNSEPHRSFAIEWLKENEKKFLSYFPGIPKPRKKKQF